ncbi:hypothetical protein SAMN06309944_2346 [Micrococcales bacterium KH10]|nr:hypothetical protein SAMN06309944_2346 [Micrococcales bacterium KH10]
MSAKAANSLVFHGAHHPSLSSYLTFREVARLVVTMSDASLTVVTTTLFKNLRGEHHDSTH